MTHWSYNLRDVLNMSSCYERITKRCGCLYRFLPKRFFKHRDPDRWARWQRVSKIYLLFTNYYKLTEIYSWFYSY